MAARFRRSSFFRGRAPRRQRQWAITDLGTGFQPTAAGLDSVDLLAGLESELGYEQNNITVLNIRGRLFPRWGADPAAGDASTLFLGITFVSQQAFAVAAGAGLPDPAVDNADWMWHDVFTIGSNDTNRWPTSLNGFAGLEINNRSMRKMRENNSVLALIANNQSNQGTGQPIIVLGGLRVLVALP